VAIVEELEALLAQRDVCQPRECGELLRGAVVIRDVGRRRLSWVLCRDGQHRWREIDPQDAARRANASRGGAAERAGAAGDIEHAHTRLELRRLHEVVGERGKEGGDEEVLVEHRAVACVRGPVHH
jgi:hypothetical protein